MSSAPARAAYLRLEEQLRECLAKIERLEKRVEQLEAEREAERFELVSDLASSALVSESPEFSSASVHRSSNLEEEIRRDVLVQIGSWIRSSLDGRRRGLSGRERLNEGNGCYLVFKNFSGAIQDPVRVFDRFSDLVPEVKPFGHPGGSIFIGLPTVADARIVTEAAGVQWPQ